MGTKGDDTVGLQLFDSRKQHLVDEALLALSLDAPDDAAMLRKLRNRLVGINTMLDDSPSPTPTGRCGRCARPRFAVTLCACR